MLTGEKAEVVRIVCRDDATPEPHCGSHRESVDRHLAPRTSIGEEVARDSSDPGASGDDLCESSPQQSVDGLVSTVSSVQLDEHSGGDTDRRIPLVGATHRGAHALMTPRVLPWPGEGGDRFAVED